MRRIYKTIVAIAEGLWLVLLWLATVVWGWIRRSDAP